MDPETTLSLGLSLGPKLGAAVLIGPTGLISAAVESRAGSRVRLPMKAIQHCLEQGGLKSTSQVGVMALQTRQAREQRSWIENLFAGTWGTEGALRGRLQKDLSILGDPDQFPEMILVNDEQALARGIFVSRAGEPGAILNLDMPFVRQSTALWRGGAAGLESIWHQAYPQSLELLTANLAGFSGFRGRLGQRQFLQLAEYGEPRYVDKIREHLFHLEAQAQFSLGLDYLSLEPATEARWLALADLFTGEARNPAQPIGSREIDLAHSLLEVTNEWALALTKYIEQELVVPQMAVRGQGPLFDRLKALWRKQSLQVIPLSLQNDSLLMASGAAVEGLIAQQRALPPVSILRLPELAANVTVAQSQSEMIP